MLVLGIESSCDETGTALYDSDKGLLSHALHSQVAIHNEYGGVVPELASRDHIKRIIPLIKKVLKDGGRALSDLDAVAYTAGPGLIGALLVGAVEARSLAYSLGIKAVAVHHMEGHLLAPMLEDDPPELPFVALLVSGGHTMLIRVRAIGSYEILGQSVDDAAGEAFDKTAKLLGLPYPGGPHLEKLAAAGTPGTYKFPRPMVASGNCDFSFAGLKTAVLHALRKSDGSDQAKADLARGFTEAVADTLYAKCAAALDLTGYDRLVVSGGVSANSAVRDRLCALMEDRGGRVFFARREFCTDNGAMIAKAGMVRFLNGEFAPLGIDVHPRWPLSDLRKVGERS